MVEGGDSRYTGDRKHAHWGPNFADIFMWFCWMKIILFWFKFTKLYFWGPTDDKSSLVHVMVWCLIVDKTLPEIIITRIFDIISCLGQCDNQLKPVTYWVTLKKYKYDTWHHFIPPHRNVTSSWHPLSWKMITYLSYTLGREYRVVRSRY